MKKILYLIIVIVILAFGINALAAAKAVISFPVTCEEGMAPAQYADGSVTCQKIDEAIRGCPEGFTEFIQSSGTVVCEKVVPEANAGTKEQSYSNEVVPENGKCAGNLVVSKDGTKCFKPNETTVNIVHATGVKEAVFNTGGVTITDKDGKDVAQTPNQGVKASVSIDTGNGLKNIVVEKAAADKMILISAFNKSVSTKEEVKIKDDKLVVNDKEIKVMPDTASARAIEVLGEKYDKIELKDTGVRATSPRYDAVKYEEAKLLGFIKVKIAVTASVNAIDGETKLKKSWWRFMTF